MARANDRLVLSTCRTRRMRPCADPARWDPVRIERAGALLARAAARDDPGSFQIEAAIQAAHCHRARSGSVPWTDIARLYTNLLALNPTIGARIGHAVASARASADPSVGLQRLAGIDSRTVRMHQSWWAARAHLLAESPGRGVEAADAYARALSLTVEPALRHHLERRLEVVRASLQ